MEYQDDDREYIRPKRKTDWFSPRKTDLPTDTMHALIGILATAERIGRAETGLILARNPDCLTYESEDSIVRRLMWNEVSKLVKFQQTCHPAAHPTLQADLHTRQNELLQSIMNDAVVVANWTFGETCAWFSGERDGHAYTVFFMPGLLRMTVDMIAHTCDDCGVKR
jgi:hypothetical protein